MSAIDAQQEPEPSASDDGQSAGNFPGWLLDLEEIKTLKARYFRFVDTKQWDDYRSLFTLDATVLYPGIFDAPSPVDEKLEAIKEAVAGCLTIHQGFNPEISRQDADAATAIWAMEDNLFWPDPGMGGDLYIRGFGYYHEAYRRVGAHWRIHRLVFERRALVTRRLLRGETLSIDPAGIRWAQQG